MLSSRAGVHFQLEAVQMTDELQGSIEHWGEREREESIFVCMKMWVAAALPGILIFLGCLVQFYYKLC